MNSISRSDRIFFLDLLKAISISAVVFYHSVFFPIETYYSVAISELIISAPLRFCVPLFLIISIFLLERELSQLHKSDHWQICKKRLIRIAVPTVFWFGVAALLSLIKGNSLYGVLTEILTGNIFIGASFLLILLQLIPLYILCRPWFARNTIVWSLIGLQIAVFIILKILLFYGGDLGTTVIETLNRLDRPCLIYWLAYMPLGYFLYHQHDSLQVTSESLAWGKKLGLLVAVSLLLTFEYANLIPNIGNQFYTYEYALVGCLMSAGLIFFLTCSMDSNQIGHLWLSLVNLLAKYSLGIFCINGLLSQGFATAVRLMLNSTMEFNLLEVLIARVLGWMVLLALSLFFSIQIDRLGFKSLVR